jgi:hypothetical protein
MIKRSPGIGRRAILKLGSAPTIPVRPRSVARVKNACLKRDEMSRLVDRLVL